MAQRSVAASIGWWIAIAFALAAPPPAPCPATLQAEKALRAAGIEPNGPGLLAFIRKNTLSEDDLKHLADAVRLLSSDDFEERETAHRDLVHAGRAALPFLRRALDAADAEVARRARMALAEIKDSSTPVLLTLAAQLLAERRPDGAVPVLLAYLSPASDPVVEETFLETIETLGLLDGKPDAVLVGAIADRQPLRRAAAARALGHAEAAAVRRPVLALLTDLDARVRFEAARALLQSGQAEAVPVLVALLTEGPFALACQAESLLFSLPGPNQPQAVLLAHDANVRRRCRDAWQAWWKANGSKIDLARRPPAPAYQGLTLVCEFDGVGPGGRVWEAGPEGKPLWEVTDLQGPNSAQTLTGGRFLVAERNGNRVTERDRSGRVLWSHLAPAAPIGCQRLTSGNTVVTTFSEVYEIGPDHKRILTCKHSEGFRQAQKLANGHLLFITSTGRVVERDALWKETVRDVRPSKYGPGAGYWASVETLAAGRFLLALGGAGKVLEIDSTGAIVWESSQPWAVSATRLPNGHTLVASFEARCLIELDREGKAVNRTKLPGRPFTARRY